MSFKKRCIFIYDFYSATGHNIIVLTEIEKLGKVIPIFLEGCKFYKRRGIDHDNNSKYKDIDKLDLYDVYYEEGLQQ